jgi:hypothetical protein
MFYGTQTAQRDGDDGGGLGPLVITPTITTVIATHTNIEFSTRFRNVLYDFTIGIFPITLRHLEWTLRRNLITAFTKPAPAKINVVSI